MLPFFNRPKKPNVSRFIKDNGQEKVIVFIHGITGDAEKTWHNENSGTYWPILFADDPAFDGFDIYVIHAYPVVSAHYQMLWLAIMQRLRDILRSVVC